MKDRRSGQRKPTILEGRIRIDDHSPDIECTVRDLSETGAQIWAPPSVDLPGEFDLDIPKRGQTLRAQVVWSKGRNHGVAFVGKQPEAGRESMPLRTPPSEPRVRDILADARHLLAQAMDVPADSIRLTLEIDG